MPIRFSYKKYTEKEMIQMEAVQRYYKQDVSENLHPFLQMSEEDPHTPRYSSSPVDFQRGSFQSRLGEGLLATEAENLLVNVLQYQHSRYHRDPFRSGYLNDPTNLLCEVLKHWAIDTLSHQQVDERLRGDIESWIKFVHNLTISSIFPPGGLSEETFESVLVNIRNLLRYQLRPKLLKELNCLTSREYFTLFIQKSKQILSHGVQFLYYVLRDTEKTPRNCTIPNLQAAAKSIERILYSTSGRLLQALCLSAPFQSLFPVCYVAGGVDPNTQILLSSSLSSFTISGSLSIPPIILQCIQKDTSPSSSSSSSLQRLRGEFNKDPLVILRMENAGIAKAFQKKELLESYVKLHELFLQFANLVQLFEQAKGLAGQGGNLLIYIYARKQISNLIIDYNLLANSIRDTLYIIEQHADGLYQQIVRENKNIYPHWKENYLYVSNISSLLNDDFDYCHKVIYDIREQATAYANTAMVMKQTMKKIADFEKDSLDYSANLRSFLQIDASIHPDDHPLQEIDRTNEAEFSQILHFDQSYLNFVIDDNSDPPPPKPKKPLSDQLPSPLSSSLSSLSSSSRKPLAPSPSDPSPSPLSSSSIRGFFHKPSPSK